ncbi:iron ABC transporter permease [Clostridium perfringens]|uniref:FecCD family ABC transporter permease n=1 Tax=Clostridium perfringens TaxID=1502 RepID=UPI001C84C42E|nr:iron ABC transporter permease [Clostridium perfringens]MDK0574213.1 iron ABC transporter permease [Clostridium perfringens]
MQESKKRKLLILLAIPLVILVLFIGTSIGSSNINIWDTISIVGNKIFNIPLRTGIKPEDVAIIWVIRLPRVLLAFGVGASLAVSGAIIQSILKNPLASPYTLGVSSGASLGVGIYIVLGISIPVIGNLAMPIIGFLCGVLTVFAVIIFSNKVDRGLSNNTVILAGMVLSLFTSAMLTTVTSICSEDLKAITMWQMGSFAMKSWSYVLVGIPFLIIGIFMAVRYTREMDILSFGEDGAKAIGVETKKVKKTLLVSVAILTGSAVALSGVIGFIDLITPHIVRKIFGASHKIVIPMCIILGGTLMVLTDLVSRTLIAPSELPVGAITALIGAPFFAYLYFGKRSR